MTPIVDRATSRRRFIQFLAASPLFAGTSLAALAAEPGPERPADPFVWAPRDYDHLIASPKEALDVFDFEPVMHKNVPPAHFGYMASGVDDDVTLRANREGFLKFQLRPRRLVDVSKVDMSTEILGQRYETPIIIDPTGGHRGYHPDGEGAVARAAKIGDHLMILSTQATTSVADVIAARGRPIWSQLYATNKFEVAKHHVESMERQGSIAVAVTVDRNGGRNQEVALRMRRLDTRECSGCHDRSSLASLEARQSDVRRRGSLRAQEYPVLRHVVGLHQAAARPDQDENGAQGHPRLGGCQDRRRDRHRRDHRVESRRPRRRIRPLHHREPARDHCRSPAPCRC